MTKSVPLGHDFSRIWSASLITNLVDGVLRLAAPLLAVSLTEDPILIGALTALGLLPWLFFAIPIGAIVDRVDRRKALVLGNSLRAAIALFIAFAVSQGFINIWLLLISVFFFGICEVLVDTTSQAVLPQILDKSNYERGNSRLQISEVIVSQFAGAPLSGLLYAVSIALPFFFSTTGFILAGLLILLFPFESEINARKEGDAGQAKLGLKGDIKFALNYLYQDKQIFSIVVITTLLGFFYSLSNAIAPLFILKELKVSPALFGVFFAIQGVGALAGSIAAPMVSKYLGRGKALAINVFFASLLVIFIGLSPNAYFFVAVSVLIGFTISVWNILLMSLYQSLIPPELYGRIHGARRTIVWGLMPIGAIIGGVIARGGLRLPFLIGGVIATLIASFSYKHIKRIGDLSAEISDKKD
ncbi:MAG: MFS transporter [Actinobacteria bacterium]|nr:MFS transporter [Actinomycetota bacterium]NDA36636.1 MFS transporter [Actinomycetota bacterium]NDC91186.1 MFS transporter [Acidimicrobiia bacterium]